MSTPQRQTLFSPGDDCRTPLLARVAAAVYTVRVATFTFHIPALTDALIALHGKNVDVGCLFDAGQAATFAPMAAELARLKAAGVPYLIGTSPKHAYLHHKFVVIDATWTLSGSYNLSLGSQEESNHLDLERSLKRAAQFVTAWTALHDWIQANEPQPP